MSKESNVDELLKKLVIQRIRGKYFNQLLKLIESAFQKEIELTGFDKRRLSRAARFYRLFEFVIPVFDAVHADFPTILVATSNDVLIGEMHAVPHGKGIWSLDSSAVDPMFRGRGVYGRLMNEVISYICRKGGRKIVTSLWTNNIAPIKVTAQYGFRTYEEDILLFLKLSEKTLLKERFNGSIREAKPSDQKKLYEICRLVYKKKIDAHEMTPRDFFGSFSNRLLNRILGTRSKLWLVEDDGAVAYASVLFTNPQEAGSIDYFAVVPFDGFKNLETRLLNHILEFFSKNKIEKVVVSLNKERKQTIEVFQQAGFKPVASIYEMVRDLAE